MKKARSQKGSLCLSVNGSGTEVWIFRWWETSTDGRRVRRKRQVGTLDQYKTEEAAERAVRNWRLVLRANQDGAASGITMRALIGHFREKELVDKGEDGRAWSTRDRYEAYLNSWIEPRWGKEELTAIRAPLVEEWLRNLQQKPRKRKRPELVATGRESKPLALPEPPAICEPAYAPTVDLEPIPAPVAPSWAAPAYQPAPVTATPYYGPPRFAWEPQAVPVPANEPEPISGVTAMLPAHPVEAPVWRGRA